MKSKLLFLASFVLLLNACKKENTTTTTKTESSIMPQSFSVQMSSAISNSSVSGKMDGLSFGKTQGDTISGEDIYKNVRLFIKIGDFSAKVVESIMNAIAKNGINKPMDITFTGDDGRTKHLVVTENATYESINYKYKLNVDDDGNKALQLFWDPSPIKGVAIMSAYEIDRKKNAEAKNTLYKVEYSEAEGNYDARMIVSLYNLPEDSNDNGSIDNLKMFVGKKGDVIDIYGNSNHPNVKIIDPTYAGGRNYAFVARANNSLDIAVAKVSLPPSAHTSTTDLFTAYSVDSVIRTEVKKVFPLATDAMINPYLKNAEMPGYFTKAAGFIGSGTTLPTVTGFNADFVNLSGLSPYVPNDIKNLMVAFQ